MELPGPLRTAVDAALEGAGRAALARAAESLSERYRAEVRDGRLHVHDELAALAYAAVRLPATYAAVRASLESVWHASPDFAPATALDVGAGPGTALWAAAERWPSLGRADLVEASPAFRRLGATLAAGLRLQTRWHAEDAAAGLRDLPPADLVTVAYVLNELAEEARPPLLARLWELSSSVLVIVEPGTPAGWSRILAARSQLAGLGAHVLAPCPHARACPLRAPDWCHFSRRVARSKIHRLTKAADAPWEDEKYLFLAAGRRAAAIPAAARIIAPVRTASGQAWLKLCDSDGRALELHVTRREGDSFKAARRAGWGDAVDLKRSSS